MQDPYLYPKLRWPIDIRMHKLDKDEILLLTCPLGISKQPLGLVPAVAPIIGSFDGSLSISEITDKFSKYKIKTELVEKLVSLLDENLFLATPKYFAAEKESRDLYINSKVRPAALAGGAYSQHRETLQKQIDDFLNTEPVTNGLHKKGPMVGLVAPHIDYRRGGISYGLTYKHLSTEEHHVYIVIGTSHQYSKHLFHLSAKDFETPLGILPCDTALVTQLASLYGVDRSFADEILHRREHSLELQLPFMQRAKGNATIVPILVGSFHHMLTDDRAPQEFDEYESFASSLTECLRQKLNANHKICFVAGVDMAHVGQNFGDKEPLSAEGMLEVERRDRIYLDSIVAHDKVKLFEHIAEDGDKRRICGFPTMYTVLDVLERLKIKYEAHVFDYRQAVDYQTQCAVTFAGLGFYIQ